MFKTLSSLPLLCCAIGCGWCSYHRTPTGQLTGTVYLAWVGPDEFIYIKSKVDPVRFVRSDGSVVEPETMYTDGGSIPRLAWASPQYSPWRFAPAYIVHDWLFVAHHCHDPHYENYDVYSAADVMMECVKTLMKADPKHMENITTFDVLRFGVRSGIAKNLWDTGTCRKPDERARAIAERLSDQLDRQRADLVKAATSDARGAPAAVPLVVSVDDWATLTRRPDKSNRILMPRELRDDARVLIAVTVMPAVQVER